MNAFSYPYKNWLEEDERHGMNGFTSFIEKLNHESNSLPQEQKDQENNHLFKKNPKF